MGVQTLLAWRISPIESANYTDWTPFQVNYSDPMFLHLDQTGGWKKKLVVIEEDKGPEDWVSFVFPNRFEGA